MTDTKNALAGQLLSFLQSNPGGASIGEIEKALPGHKRSSILAALRGLRADKQVEMQGAKRGARYVAA